MFASKSGKGARKFFSGHPARMLVAAFIGCALFGAALLKLPIATVDQITFIDALFTSMSAFCVTGLMVVDVGTTFTLFGQLVILALIQVGGLGIMTFSVFFSIALGLGFSLRQSSYFFEAFDLDRHMSLKSLLVKIMGLTFAIEFLGAGALFISFRDKYEFSEALYYSIFHAISGFCNAGITLFPTNLVAFGDEILIPSAIGSLCLVGSIGFITIVELYSRATRDRKARAKRKPLTLQTQILLFYSGAILFLTTALIFLLEGRNEMSEMSWVARLFSSTFVAASSRTAGFNTVDIAAFSNDALFVLMVMMFIGAAPGSVGGGIKITTFAVLLAMARARFFGQDQVSFSNRAIPIEVVRRSISIVFISVQIIVVYTFILSITEGIYQGNLHDRARFIEILFDVVSAFGTVGMSSGLTGELSPIGRLLITSLMLIGRLGPLTVAFAIARENKSDRFRYAEEGLMVG